MIEGDPVDVALELAVTIEKPGGVALVNMANDKKPGGDWEAGQFLEMRNNVHHLKATRSSCTRGVYM